MFPNSGFAFHSQGKYSLAVLFFRGLLVAILVLVFHLGYAFDSGLQEKYDQGMEYFHQGRYQKAQEVFKKIITQDPSEAKVYNDLGMTYVKTGHLKKAVEVWEKGLNVNPSFLTIRYNLVKAYIDIHNYDKAIIHLKFIINNFPKEAKAYNTLGVVYWIQGRLEEAEAAFKKAILIEPSYKIAHFNLARLYLKKAILEYQVLYKSEQNNAKLREEYKRILKVNPQDAKSHFLLGQLYLQEGNFEQAISEYRLAARLDETYGYSLFIHKAIEARSQGDIQRAIQNYKIALNLVSNSKKQKQARQIYYELGKLYYLSQKYEDALFMFKRAVCLWPRYSYVYHYLGLTYFQLGEYSKAIEAFKKAILYENNYKSHYALASVYEKTGQYRLAQREYKQAIVLNPRLKDKIKIKSISLSQRSTARGLNKEVKEFISHWLYLWQKRKFNEYAACYSAHFYTKGKNLRKWLEWKRHLFATRKNVNVKIDNLRIIPVNKIIMACFDQVYQDNVHMDKGLKCLYLHKAREGWKILKEEWHKK